MFNRPEITAEWTVHAQVTISHPMRSTADDSRSEENSTSAASNDDGNVRVVYSWHGHSGDDQTTTRTFVNPSDAPPGYGFNRGGVTFTAIPPPKCQPMSDSGYTSEKPCRVAQPYDRRCRSTCSIVLSSPHAENVAAPCRRTTSLRYPQSPISGEPAEPIPRRAHTFTTHFCTELPERKTEIRDAASQTTPIVTENETEDERDGKARRRLRMYGRRRHETDSAAILGTRNSRTPGRRLSRSPASKLISPSPTSNITTETPIKINGQTTNLDNPDTTKPSNGASSSDSRKPRTVHIDVYCTGSEPEDDEHQENEESTNSENEDTMSASSPQTVFESEQVRVRHKRIADMEELPKALLMRKICVQPSPSSGYPSLASSSSTVARGLSGSNISSLMNSGSRIGYDSSATSWKDTTTSDMESLLNTNTPNSRALSMAPSADSFEYENPFDRERIQALDKLMWIEEKTWKSPEFERRLLLRAKLKSMDSEDSVEDDDEDSNSWIFSKTDEDSPCSILNKREDLQKSPSHSRYPQRKVPNSSLEKKPVEQVTTKDILPTETSLNQTSTDPIPKPNFLNKKTYDITRSAPKVEDLPLAANLTKQFSRPAYLDKPTPVTNQEFTHRLTIAPCGFLTQQKLDSPQLLPIKESSRSTSPFVNTLPGYATGHLERARRFGNVVGTLRKPGHHVGPSKNPDCSCEHCRRYCDAFRNGATRGRTLSAGSVQLQRSNQRWYSKRNSSEEPESYGYGWSDL